MASEALPLSDPTDLIAQLSPVDKNQYGNTPIPGKSELLLLSGMQKLRSSDWEGASEKLNSALEQAILEKSGEAIGSAKTCLGYFYAKKNDAQNAEKFYLEAFDAWKEGLTKKKKYDELIGYFFQELCSLYQWLGKLDKVEKYSKEAIVVVEANLHKEKLKKERENELKKELAGLHLSVAMLELGDVLNTKEHFDKSVSLLSDISSVSGENKKMHQFALQKELDYLKKKGQDFKEVEHRLRSLN